ncbi:FkbM family methyltransferase [Thiorhodovibrio litoralis]|uniref:FkbM family methyltransferase n=1 Tax=Thiorhodovibrio litoralis TaxID=2952932 RepID=UPI002B2638DE|nr:FkbM family methyltransferase [Thiorhodovibrio litoralis]WPL14183.1 methyltransferase, FkbM family [Thiorhodovibrio litoralis]
MDQDQWRRALLGEFFRLMGINVNNNYDKQRFSYDGIDRSQANNVSLHANYLNWFIDHSAELFATWLLLRDDDSRTLLDRLILFRLLGHRHVVIRPGVDYYMEQQAVFEKAQGWEVGPAELSLSGLFGAVKRYRGTAFGRTITLDAWAGSVACSFLAQPRQYYFERAGVRIAPEPGDWIIDGGACLGETAVAFAISAGETGRVLSFDPLPQHQKATQHNAKLNELDTIKVLPYALGAKTNVTFALPPDQQEADQSEAIIQTKGAVVPGFSILGRESGLPVVALDDYLAQHPQERLDFIKLDIEGAELAALQGASATIKRYRPKLAISLYHKIVDFVAIPHFIAAAFPYYDFYLDHHTIHAEETVLYASPR